MNEFERADAVRVGTVIRAARKLRGLSQSEISRELQISQVALSNVERGQAAISGSLWFRFCETLKLLPDHAFSEGIIDGQSSDGFNDPLNSGFKIPKRYANNAFSTMRTAQPFLRYFEKCFGRNALEAFMKERLGVDPDIRHVYNMRISLRFNCDVATHLIQAGRLKPATLHTVTQTLTDPKTHGLMSRFYEENRNPLMLIKTLMNHISRYEQNFTYTVIDETRSSLDISSVPADFTRYFYYREDELPHFTNLYRLSYIESFSRYGGRAQPLKASLIPSATKRQTECVFRVSI